MKYKFCFISLMAVCICQFAKASYTDVCELGFSTEATGVNNQRVLQQALDKGGTIIVSKPGTYRLAGTVYIGDDTTLEFCSGSTLQKVDEVGKFGQVIKNKGALSRTWNERITIRGLHLSANGVEVSEDPDTYGIRGLIAFYGVKELRIEGFRCYDLMENQYCIHVCKFEDLHIDNAIIKGLKDGIHIGRGKRFHISNCVFQTVDDAIALNGADYPTGQPEFGWIEDGLIENCHDLRQGDYKGAFFCRMLGGSWSDWEKGMQVTRGQVVVSNGWMYRARTGADWKKYTSKTRPDFTERTKIVDGITWERFQDEITYTSGVRNVTIRDIYLSKPREAFGIVIENSEYCRAYTAGSTFVPQENIHLENIHVLYDEQSHLIVCCSPIPEIIITGSHIRNNDLYFYKNTELEDFGPTTIKMMGCTVKSDKLKALVTNEIPGKQIKMEQALVSSNIPLE